MFYAWLKGKADHEDSYQVLMGLVKADNEMR